MKTFDLRELTLGDVVIGMDGIGMRVTGWVVHRNFDKCESSVDIEGAMEESVLNSPPEIPPPTATPTP